MDEKYYYFYLLANNWNTVLYAGVTSDLVRRVWEHKQGFVMGFTKKYNVHKLVYYEVFQDVENAISREKQVKAGSRQKKEDLINKMNPEWKDLFAEISGCAPVENEAQPNAGDKATAQRAAVFASAAKQSPGERTHT